MFFGAMWKNNMLLVADSEVFKSKCIYIYIYIYTHIKEISEYLIICPSICFATTRIADPSKQHGACISPCHIT